MKRLMLIAGLLLPLALIASPVSSEKAASVAGKVLGTRASELKLLTADRAVTKSMDSAPAYYVFTKPGRGFAIIAGDDVMMPVIGYSTENIYREEGQPENLRSWLKMWSDITAEVRRRGYTQDKATAAAWVELEKNSYWSEGSGGTLLETALWDQGSPYNAFCPIFSGSQSVTGCVATATAIVMRYFKYPDHGAGTLPSYKFRSDSGEDRMVNGLELGDSYLWDQMPLEYTGRESDAERNAVASLMRDLGVMVKMEYDPSGSGAMTSDAALGLVKYMGYDASLQYRFKEYSSVNDWIQMLKDNIDNVGPVIYDGQGEDVGHCFVLDGYNAQSQFRINWGWGGYGNGFFSVPNFDEYTQGHSAIFGVRPSEGGIEKPFLAIDGNGKEKGMVADTDLFLPGKPFRVDINYIFNMGLSVFTGDIALVRVNKEGKIVEVIDADYDNRIGVYSGGGFYYDSVILDEINVGDKLMMACRNSEDSDWVIVDYNHDNGTNGFIPIADANSIEELTTVKYTAETSILVISTKKDASYTLVDADGKELKNGVSFTPGVITIDCNKVVKGTYVLTLTKNSEKVQVSLIMGK